MLTGYLANPTPMPVDIIFLDEAQDLSALQWACFREMAKDAKRIYMAGDDDQAIYGFIGGSEYGFLDHPADQEHLLGKSWRVPRAVGQQADAVIAKVGHRKAKAVEWMDKPGELSRWGLDAFTLPWRSLLADHQSIMVLARHRKGARNFSDDLKAVGIPHDLNGDGLKAWKEAKIAEAFLRLQAGEKVTVRQAMLVLNALDLPGDMLKGMRPRQTVGKTLLPSVDWKGSMVEMFGGFNAKKVKRYEAIRQLVNQDGLASLAKEPTVRVSTMHAAKGAEADLVIIVPECNGIVRRNILTPAEIRLAYVTMTRLVPRSDNYITHFFGG
jgi:superfamily I DNA/RNA helicase